MVTTDGQIFEVGDTRQLFTIQSISKVFAYRVGIPAKSGVSGGIIAVVPGKAGIATFSPLTDKNGNSVRGLKVFEALSQEYGLHLFDLSMGRCLFSQSLE